jgi:hypothetical protein
MIAAATANARQAAPRALTIPALSLVVLIGPSGCGKSTFARTHFKPTEILSSDFYRGLVSDDENDQSATKDAFEVLHAIAAKRLARAGISRGSMPPTCSPRPGGIPAGRDGTEVHGGKELRKVVYVPNRLLNLVVV